jgi:hypothetical protein
LSRIAKCHESRKAHRPAGVNLIRPPAGGFLDGRLISEFGLSEAPARHYDFGGGPAAAAAATDATQPENFNEEIQLET